MTATTNAWAAWLPILIELTLGLWFIVKGVAVPAQRREA